MATVTTITQRAENFTDRDFDSWIRELRTRASSAFPGWTDFNTPNIGNIFLEMFAHTLDVLSYTQDQQHIERFVVFARLRRSMINLGKNFGFALPGATAATVDLEISYADGNPRTKDLVVPKGTVIRNVEGDAEFDLTADATILTGFTQLAAAPAENARERNATFVADGSPNLPVPLASTPFVPESADGNVVVGAFAYTEVEDFLSSTPTDKHFRVELDEVDRALLLFGDGINGEAPSGAGTVVYKTGGGSLGNVEPNTLVQFRDGNQFATVGGETVQLTVRNPAAAAGGRDRMSVEEARVAIPASTRTVGDRSVTREDFEDNARKVRGVARALMLTADDDPSIPENEGLLFVIPVGGGLPSAALKTEVFDLITNDFPPTITFTFTVEDPTLLIVSITATVYLNQGITEPEARTAIEESLDAFFALLNEDLSENTQIDFGFKIRTEVMPPGSLAAELPWSDLFNAIRDAANPAGALVLRKVDEDTVVPADDVILTDRQFTVLGSITLTNGDTAAPF